MEADQDEGHGPSGSYLIEPKNPLPSRDGWGFFCYSVFSALSLARITSSIHRLIFPSASFFAAALTLRFSIFEILKMMLSFFIIVPLALLLLPQWCSYHHRIFFGRMDQYIRRERRWCNRPMLLVAWCCWDSHNDDSTCRLDTLFNPSLLRKYV